jgi:hypothetical protein
VVDELFIAYGGAEGGLHQNTYYDFKEENPFVSPTLLIAPTSQVFNVFAGAKGKLSNSVGYNARASFGREEGKALFLSNPYQGRIPNLEGYAYGNSFGVVYDDVNTLDIFGELKVEVSNNFALGASANVYSYGLGNLDEAWNLPALKASVFSNFNITEKVYGGASIFFVGERNAQTSIPGGINPNNGITENTTLDAYADINLHLGYRYSDRLNFFVRGSNLLSDNYEKWADTPVQGIQALLGATYKFDW